MVIGWLTALALLPMLGAGVVALVKGPTGRLVGMGFAVATLALGVVVAVLNGQGTNLAEKVVWIRAFGAYYSLGLDGMGLLMVLMTVVLVPLVLLAEWRTGENESGRWQSSTYVAFVLALESLALFVFLATDVLLFYVFFEATLVPMYFLIAGWGGAKRSAAALKFLLYSLVGGLVMLFAVIGVGVLQAQTGNPSYLLTDLMKLDIPTTLEPWLFAGFMIAFIIKAPMVPLHTWLPDVAEQATPGSSTLLVGVLDKIGTFGMIRLCLGIFPETSRMATPVMIVLAIISILYGAIAAIGQKDLMRFVAFTSVSHFGVMVLGIFAFTSQSITGSVFFMLNHGFSTAAMFLILGFLIKRRGSSLIGDTRGVFQVAPVLAGVSLLAGLSSLGLPGYSTFVSEFLVLAGTWSRYPVQAGISVFVTVLAALYVLWVYQRVMTGEPTDEVRQTVTTDLDLRERLVMAPLIAVMLVLGFFPKPALDAIAPLAQATMSHVGVADPTPAAKGVK
ncbi:MAG TPA: NADH-quinone oxidoreductase subunit M [Propionibacteriaceae bacterium]|nr:NADH-quinone oxidoreductase subunit M [Propionibacteriaceae bacterium]HPZ50372.1 NADH-quinone oxidoreductase subunit M [Propionibacteriaceae bacterium]HQE32203.1 NADH-quinone oxidoreductase subunit M [Propionibacteriaceae bacterium]